MDFTKRVRIIHADSNTESISDEFSNMNELSSQKKKALSRLVENKDFMFWLSNRLAEEDFEDFFKRLQSGLSRYTTVLEEWDGTQWIENEED